MLKMCRFTTLGYIQHDPFSDRNHPGYVDNIAADRQVLAVHDGHGHVECRCYGHM